MPATVETTPPPALMTIREVAAFFRVEQRTIGRWVAQKRIPRPKKICQKLLWTRKSLEAYVEALEGHKCEGRY
jgi:excisionase family DNA binding protein